MFGFSSTMSILILIYFIFLLFPLVHYIIISLVVIIKIKRCLIPIYTSF